MKKWILLVLVLTGGIVAGQAQIKIGNRTINTKKVLSCFGCYFVGRGCC